MADIPVLVCTAGALSGKRIPVPEGGLGIGRSPENAVVIQDEGVSRYHARLLFENGSLWLQDAGSRNGVFVNGVRVTGHKALKVGDSMTIAEHSFELRWLDEEASADAAVRLLPGAGSGGGATPASAGARPENGRGAKPAATDRSVDAGSDAEAMQGQPAARRRWFWPFT